MWPTTQRPAAAVPRPDITRLYRPRQLRREAGEGAGHDSTIVTESAAVLLHGVVLLLILIQEDTSHCIASIHYYTRTMFNYSVDILSVVKVRPLLCWL